MTQNLESALSGQLLGGVARTYLARVAGLTEII